MKTLLMINGGYEALAGIQLARDMGLQVAVSDRDPEAPGFALAHHRMLASTYDPAETVAAATRFHRNVQPIDGVMCLAADVPVTVAAVAERLGLPGIPLTSARLTVDKLAMKEKFAADGVPIPWFAAVADAETLHEIRRQRTGRLVLKPIDSRGSRGVLQIDEDTDLDRAWTVTRDQSPTGRAMIEQFLDGPQISTESIILDGVAHTPAFADRNYEFLNRFAPHIIENGGDMPSRLTAVEKAAVGDVIQCAADSLGIENGILKGDIVLHDGQPFIIEVAARLSGGFFCTHKIPLSTGVSTIRAVIRLALGETVTAADLTTNRDRGAVERRLFADPGTVRSIEGIDQAGKSPGVQELIVNVRPGQTVRNPTDSTGAAVIILADGESAAEARARVDVAMGHIRIITDGGESGTGSSDVSQKAVPPVSAPILS